MAEHYAQRHAAVSGAEWSWSDRDVRLEMVLEALEDAIRPRLAELALAIADHPFPQRLEDTLEVDVTVDRHDNAEVSGVPDQMTVTAVVSPVLKIDLTGS